MPATQGHVAIDLGAESGRVMLGRVDPAAGRIALEEVHRFPTSRSLIDGTNRWDVQAIHNEILAGLSKAAADNTVASASVDSWGVDYALLGPDDAAPLTPPFMYRDSRTDGVSASVQADETLRRLVFEETGIQFLPFNTLYQLMAEREQAGGRELHEAARGLLMLGDYFNWRLCGVARAERSLASTSQLYNPRTRAWSRRLVETFDLRGELLPELADSGTVLGPLRPEIAKRTGLLNAQVIATCSHDTAAAVAATPLAGEDAAYLSSGTWSLLGVETAEPVITDECREVGFTNEVGFGHSVRLLKNISGLFILQECRRELGESGREIDYPELARLAGKAPSMRSLIRPDAPEFSRVGGMLAKIQDCCRGTRQPVPAGPGEIARCVYDSLSLLYARTLGEIQRLTGRRITCINVVGGGSRSALLNQLTADACGVPVEAGPGEATALGNIGIQSIALGGLSGIPELRRAVRRSFEIQRFAPSGSDLAGAKSRFEALPVHPDRAG